MEENGIIDDFSLDKAKRNMAKMLQDSECSNGVKKIFEQASAPAMPHGPLETSAQTINIYPGAQGNDQQMLVNDLILAQRLDNAKLKERIESLEKVENRLSGLELTLKQILGEQNTLLLSPPHEKRQLSMKQTVAVAALIVVAALVYRFSYQVASKPVVKTIEAEIIKPKKVQPEVTPAPSSIAPSARFVTLKFVNMRDLPSINKGEVVLMISPNQLLTEISRKGEWIEVSYRDHLKSKQYKGWVYSENLKKMN